MNLSPSANLEERTPARVAAQSILRNGFNFLAAARELRPDLATHISYAAKLSSSPEVARQLEVILNRTERNASKFKDLMWSWLEAPPDDTKETEENRRTAARILAKPYLDPKMARGQEAAQGFVVEGLEAGAGILAGDSPSKKLQ